MDTVISLIVIFPLYCCDIWEYNSFDNVGAIFLFSMIVYLSPVSYEVLTIFWPSETDVIFNFRDRLTLASFTKYRKK